MAHLICSSVSINTHCELIRKSFFKDVMNHKARLIKWSLKLWGWSLFHKESDVKAQIELLTTSCALKPLKKLHVNKYKVTFTLGTVAAYMLGRWLMSWQTLYKLNYLGFENHENLIEYTVGLHYFLYNLTEQNSPLVRRDWMHKL